MNDTDPRMDRVQLDLLRKASIETRGRLCTSLSHTVIAASRRAVRDQMPNATEREVMLRWFRLTYGGELAERLAERLNGE